MSKQRLADIIKAFHADALTGAVNLNIDLDITLVVLAQALTAALAKRLPGYATSTPDTLPVPWWGNRNSATNTPCANQLRGNPR